MMVFSSHRGKPAIISRHFSASGVSGRVVGGIGGNGGLGQREGMPLGSDAGAACNDQPNGLNSRAKHEKIFEQL
jgi:hypothetical protein